MAVSCFCLLTESYGTMNQPIMLLQRL